jgi:hypothetical protein
MESSLWEKALIFAACALAVGFLAFAGKREFFDHQQSAPSESVQSAFPTEANSTAAGRFSDVAGVQRSQAQANTKPTRGKPKRVKAAATPAPPDRLDCDALRGIHDRTRGERQWFIDNCMFLSKKNRTTQGGQQSVRRADVEAQLQAAGFSLAEPTPRRSVGNAAATPPPELTPQVAVAKAVQWIPDNTPVMLTVSTGDCTPVWLNGHWVVTCNVTLDGCSGSHCVASLSVCVFSTEPAVVPDRFC